MPMAGHLSNPRDDPTLWMRSLDQRPWASLYGRFITTKPRKQLSALVQVRLARIQLLLTEDMLHRVFAHLQPADLVAVSLACSAWNRAAQDSKLWMRHCHAAHCLSSSAANEGLARTAYGMSWKRMYVERPFVRTDGIYVSRNTYFRLGAVHWDVKNPVHLVVYYRYFRFFADGSVLTRTSPEPLQRVWASLAHMPATLGSKDSRLKGRWRLMGSQLFVACAYPGRATSEMRCHMRLRTRLPGHNNRLDITQIFSYDRTDGSAVSLDDPAAEDTQQERVSSDKGCNTLVYVPAQQVDSHAINLGKREMDVWIPG